MIKQLGNPERKRWIGDTAGLIKLKSMGLVLRYEVATDVPEYAVRYLPRTPRDPMPWVQVGGLESRLRSTEIVAIEADAFAAWQAEQGCGAVDASDMDACGHCSDCSGTAQPATPAYTVGSYMAGPHTLFAVYENNVLAYTGYTSRYAARDKIRRLENGDA